MKHVHNVDHAATQYAILKVLITLRQIVRMLNTM